MRRNRLIAPLAVFLLMPWLHAHTLHQSTAEAEYNPTTKKLEVSLTVFIKDLELALVRQCEREMRLDKTPAAEIDAQIRAYLTKNFVATDVAGKAARIEWVGREIDEETKKSDEPMVTLFFELFLPDGLAGSRLRHAVFCEMFKDQTNLLLLADNTQRTELRFTKTEVVRGLAGQK